ncbi:MAG: FeoB-associated Cys-rich membrane protein [Clostridiaceae bacterium]
MEIIITAAIVVAAAYLLFKSVRGKAKGDCDCSSCSANCSQREGDFKGINIIKK